MNVTIPYNYEPRDYQLGLYEALSNGYKRAVAVWHRRAGKDKTLINIAAKEMFKRVGTYYYLFPTYRQGKKILWNGLDKNGFKFLNHIPLEVRKRTDNTEMLIETKNGSIFQVIGTDNIDTIVGTNPVGCIFSEYSLQDPSAWQFLAPILAENGGWAIFNYTPRGENHGYELLEQAKSNPKWFTQVLTVDDTKAVSLEEINELRKSGMSEELINQEFYCSFNSATVGAYYGSQIKQAEDENRVTNVPYEPAIKVDTWWDLGIGDSMAIWFTQTVGREIRLIDYEEDTGEGFPHYAKLLQEKPYVYGTHNAPHDIEVRELGTGKSRKEVAKSLGIDFKTVPNLSIEDGIEAVRSLFPRFWIDKEKCKKGISAIKNYRKEFDEKNNVFKLRPVHDWSSHCADALRMLAVGHKDRVQSQPRTFERRARNPLTGF